MKWYYDETLPESIKRSCTEAVVSIKDNFRELNLKDEKTMNQIKKFGAITGMFIIGFASGVTAHKIADNIHEEKYIENVQDNDYVKIGHTVFEKVEPVIVHTDPERLVPVIDGDTKKAQEIVANRHAYETSNEDVIGKAKEIIDMDTPSGSVVLDEYLKHHDYDTNEALLGTLLYIDPVAINNNVTNEEEYLHLRGIDASTVLKAEEQQAEEQGRGGR